MWPESVLRQFNALPPRPRDDELYGPYNRLLYTLFPPDSDFSVVPSNLQDIRYESYFILTFEVVLGTTPVLPLQVKSSTCYDSPSSRRLADGQMKRHIGCMLEKCRSRVHTLHAVSALGTKLCFYEFDTTARTIVPIPGPYDPPKINDVAPETRWSCDVLEDAGEKQLRKIVEKIKADCAARIS